MTALDLHYNLLELPSAHHKAGLAGLVMVLRHLGTTSKGVLELVSVSAQEAHIRLDKQGLSTLFDHIYKPATFERRTFTKPKTKAIFRGPEYVEGKRAWWVTVTVPEGSFLNAVLGRTEDEAPWVKGWRNFICYTLRQRPTTFFPYAQRAKGETPTDVPNIWDALSRGKSVPQTSVLMFGVQAFSAERVPFLDSAKNQLLLHFWCFALFLFQIRTSAVARGGKDGGQETISYQTLVGLPDVSDLEGFCAVYLDTVEALLETGSRIPTLDLPVEAGLRVASAAKSLARKVGRETVSETVEALEVFRFSEGELRNFTRLGLPDEVDPSLLVPFRSHIFRHRYLLNLLAGRPWFDGFEKILENQPSKFFEEGNSFGTSSRAAFQLDEIAYNRNLSHENMIEEQDQDSSQDQATQDSKGPVPLPLPLLIKKIVEHYVSSRLSKKGIKKSDSTYWKQRHDLAVKLQQELRTKRVKEVFLHHFGDTFAIAESPQFHLKNEENFTALSIALRDHPMWVKALTQLALSAL